MNKLFKLSLLAVLIALFSVTEAWSVDAPSQQAKYIGFSDVESTGFDLSWVNGNAAGTNGGRGVIISTDATLDITASDLDTYNNGSDPNGAWGSKYQFGATNDYLIDVVMNPNNSTTISGLTANTTYTIWILEFNGDGSAVAYQTATATLNPRSITTPDYSAPNKGAATNIMALTATLNWTWGSGEPDQCWLSVWDTDNGTMVYDFVDIGTSATSQDLVGLTASTNYDWRLWVRYGSTVIHTDWTTEDFSTIGTAAAPTIDGIVVTNDPTLNGATQVSLAIEFDQEMNPAVAPTIGLVDAIDQDAAATAIGNVITDGVLSFSYGTWGTQDFTNDTYTAVYTVATDEAAYDINIDVSLAQNKDEVAMVAVNGPYDDYFDVDTDLPSVTSIDTDIDPVYGSALTFVVTIDFDEAMDTGAGTADAIGTSIEGNFTSTNIAYQTDGSWDGDGDQWTGSFTHNNTEEEIAAEDVILSAADASDQAGNNLSADGSTTVEIDTQLPTVTSVVVSPNPVLHASAGTDAFDIVVTFSEPMNTSVDPVIGWTGGENIVVSNDYNVIDNPDAVVWSDGPDADALANDVATFTWDIFDNNVDVDDIDVIVTNGEDVAGNVMLTHNETDEIDIDQIEPTVVSITPPPGNPVVSDVEVGIGYYLDITFSEDMDQTTTPTITASDYDFLTTNDVLDVDGPNSGWQSPTVYRVAFNVNDANVEELNNNDVTVDETSTTDVYGNDLETGSNSASDVFDIDQVNPTVTLVDMTTPADDLVGGDEVGANTVTVRVTFSEDMRDDYTSDPTFTYDPVGTPTVDGALNAAPNTISDYTWVDPQTLDITFDVADNDAEETDVDVTVVGAIDDNGNALGTPDGTANVFSIDLVSPTATILVKRGADDATLVKGDAGDAVSEDEDGAAAANGIYIEITYDEDMKGGIDPVVTFPTGGENPTTSGALTYNAGASSWQSATVFRAYYDVDETTDIVMDDIDVRVNNAEDLGGSVQDQTVANDAFDVDLDEPSVLSVVGSAAWVNKATTAYTITITYDEDMNQSIDPTITFLDYNPVGTSVFGAASFTWNSPTEVEVSYTVTDQNADAAGAVTDIQVTGAEDVAGNTQNSFTKNNEFEVDQVLPTLTIAIDTDPITENDLTQQVTLTYDEEMDVTGNDPDITLPTDNTNFSAAAGSWNGPTNTIWTQVFTHGGAEQEVPSQDFTVTGATGPTDLAGNAPADRAASDDTEAFEIDTQKPTVEAVTISVDGGGNTIINDADAGANLVITVEYDENMDNGTDPTLTFATNLSATLGVAPTSVVFSNKDFTDDLVTFTYLIADGDINELDVAFDVTGALDEDGNVQNPYTSSSPDDVSIDQVNPTVLSVVGAPDPITEATVGSNTFTITVTFSEAMDPALAHEPSINFPTGGEDPTNAITSVGTAWSAGNTVWTETYDVSDSDEEIDDIDVEVGNTQDANTNTQNPDPTLVADVFSIDNVKPTVEDVVVSPSTVSNGTTSADVTIDFSEPMNTSVDPTVVFTDGTNVIDISGVFTGTPTVTWSTNDDGPNDVATLTYTIADDNQDITDIDVRTTGAQDAAGNTMDQDDEDENFEIQQDNPMLLSPNATDGVVANTAIDQGSTPSADPEVIGQTEETAGTVTIDFVFDETMNATTPTVTINTTQTTLSNPSYSQVTTTLTDDTWRVTYDVADNEETVPNVEVEITGAEDADGNDQDPDPTTVAAAFSIDTEDPTVTDVTITGFENIGGTDWVNNQVTSITVTADFSEDMEGTSTPTLSFAGTGDALTVGGAGTDDFQINTQGWTDSDTYEWVLDVNDLDKNTEDVETTVSGGTDIALNPTVSYTETSELFNVDNEEPTFAIQYFDETGKVNDFSDYDYPARKGVLSLQPDQRFLFILASEELDANPTVDIDAQGPAGTPDGTPDAGDPNDIDGGTTVVYGGPGSVVNEYRFERNSVVDLTTDGSEQEVIVIHGTDANGNEFSTSIYNSGDTPPELFEYNASFTGISAVSADDKLPGLDCAPPGFFLEYYPTEGDLDAGSNKFIDPAQLKIGADYWVKVIAEEPLNGIPTIDEVDAEGTNNDITTPGLTTIVTNTSYKFARPIVADAAAVGDVQEVWSITAQDAFGNPTSSTSSLPSPYNSGFAELLDTDGGIVTYDDPAFTDAKAPVITVSVSPSLVNDPSNGNPNQSTLTVTLDFDEEMDITGGANDPATMLSFINAATTTNLTYNTGSGTWSDGTGSSEPNDRWEGTWTHDGTAQEVSETITYDPAGGLTDLAGNEVDANEPPSTLSADFDIDTKEPSATVSWTVNDVTRTAPDMILNADEGATLKMVVVFDEDMNQTIPVTSTYSEPFLTEVTTGTTAGVDFSGWLDSDTYVFVYDIATNYNATPANGSSYALSGARDLAGNEMNGESGNGLDSDLDEPLVSSITWSTIDVGDDDNMINEDNASGSFEFEIVVAFDQTMDDGVNPTITFNPVVDGTGNTLVSINSQTWNGADDEFTVEYNVADENVEINDIDIIVSGGEDVNGNVQVSDTETNAFSIDTRAPVITSVSLLDLYGRTPAVKPGDGVDLQFTADEQLVVPPIAPPALPLSSVTFYGNNSSTIIQTGGAGVTFRATYSFNPGDVPVGTTEFLAANNRFSLNVDDGSGTVGITDVAGNSIASNITSLIPSPGTDLEVDNEAPEITDFVIDDDNTGATITFSEEVWGDDQTDLASIIKSDLQLAFNDNGSGLSLNSSWTVTPGYNTTTIRIENLSFSGGAPDGGEVLTIDAANNTSIYDKPGNALQTGGTPVSDREDNLHPVPAVSSVDWGTGDIPTPSGTYGIGTELYVVVTFSENLTTVSGPLSIDVDGFTFNYDAGATSTNPGSNDVVFSYTVQAGDPETTALDLNTSTISGAGTIEGGAGAADRDLTGFFLGGPNRNIDGIRPTVTSILRDTPTDEETNAGSVIFAVTFSESVEDVTTGDFVLTGAAASGSNIAIVSAATGTTIDVTVNTGSTDGTLGLAISGSQDINDLANADLSSNNAMTNTTPTGTVETYTIDKTAPEITSIERLTPAAALTNGSGGVVFRVTFDETIENVTPGDFVTSGAASGSPSVVSASSGTVINVTVTSITGNGNLGLELAGGSDIEDAATNLATLGTPSPDEEYTIDTQAPTVQSIVAFSGNNNTNDAQVTYRVTFDEAVTGVSSSIFTLVTVTGDITGTINSISAFSTSIYDVVVDVTDGTAGELRLDQTSAGSVDDLASNTLSGTFTSGDVFAMDRKDPAASITAPTPATVVSGSDSPTYTATDNQPGDSGIDTEEWSVNGVDWTDATGSPTFSDITGWSAISGSFTLSLRVIDNYGNQTLITQTNTKFAAIPTVQSIAWVTATGYYNDPDVLTFEVTYDESVTVTGTPTIATNVGNFSYSSGSGTTTLTFTYTVQSGDLQDDVDVTGNIVGGTIEAVSDNDPADRVISGSLATGRNVDAVDPVIAFSTPAASSYFNAGTDAITYTLTETNRDETEARINSGTWETVDGDENNSFNISELVAWAGLAEGNFTVELRHTDLATNVSTTVSRTFVKDTENPAVSTLSGDPVGTPTELVITFDEPVSTGATTPGNYTLSGYISGNPSSVTGSGNTYTLTVSDYSGISVGQSITVTVSSNVQDAAGNSVQSPKHQATWTYNGATPTKLAILSIATQESGESFDITVQSQTAGGTPANVSTTLDLSFTYSGTGTFTVNTVDPEITSGTNTAVVNVTITKAGGEAGVDISVSDTPDELTDATSNSFDVLAAEPTTQASNIQVTSQGQTTLSVQWTNGNGSARLVVLKSGFGFPASTASPTDGTNYSVNDVISGTNTVKYIGTGNTLALSNLSINTWYTFKVFEYNGSGSTINYNISNASLNPLLTKTTPKQSVANENTFDAISVGEPYPTPATNEFNFDMILTESRVITMKLYDMKGSVVLAPITNTSYNAGEHKINVSLQDANLSSGTYTLSIETGNELLMIPVSVVK